MAFGQPAYNYGYPYGVFNPVSVRPDTQIGQMYSQPVQSVPVAPQTQTQGLSQLSRAVTSKEEAMGIPADFSGALMVFPDITHNCIYVKRWNLQTGAAEFMEYVPPVKEEPKPEVDPASLYATKDDLEELSSSLEKAMKRFDGIEAAFAELKAKKGVKKNDADE